MQIWDRIVEGFFVLGLYYPTECPTENNVWGTVYGRGTFVKCFRKVRRAKEYCQQPYERLFDLRGRRFSQRTGAESIEGQPVETFDKLLHADKVALLKCGNSEDLSFIPDGVIDAVITDPPYFDNVQYSELADFFYVWLRLALQDVYPWFRPELSRRPEEIVKSDNSGKTTAFFREGLTRVFKECHRVLKDESLMIFTFHHNKTWAWESIAETLLDAGFYISASPLVRSEGKSGFHSSGGNIRYDAILVCRKQPSGWNEGKASSLEEQILSDAVYWTRRTLESGTAINAVDVFTIVMAKSIEYLTKVCGSPDFRNKPASIATNLAEMKQVVDVVAEQSRAEFESSLRVQNPEVKQLALYLRESRRRYSS